MSVFIYVLLCIKVLLAILSRIYGSKLNNLTKNMHLYSYLDNLHHYIERENGLKLKTGLIFKHILIPLVL